MNKPTFVPPIDGDIGPLDENGQQVWSPEEEAAIARLHATPGFWEGIERANADIDAGHFYTHEEVVAKSAARRLRFKAEHRH